MMTGQRGASRKLAGFTLVELLVVMAITAIMLGLVFGPMIQGFNLTNRARVQVLAQDVARSIIEKFHKEQGNSVFVFDNASQPINLWVPGQNGGQIITPVSYAWVDMVPPSRYIDQQGYAFLTQHPELIDPTTGNAIENPRLREELIRIAIQDGDPSGNQYLYLADVAVPSAPGRTFTRYWLGLRDNSTQPDNNGETGQPRRPYYNFYEEVRARIRPVSLQNHNPYVLYRAVVAPFLANGAVDTRLFRTTPNGQPILFSANFFYDNGTAVAPANLAAAYPGWKDDNGDGQVNYSENWKAASRSIVPSDRADEVVVERSENGLPLYYTNPKRNGAIEMRIVPQVRFQPNFVGNDAGAPSRLTDRGNEMPNVAASSHKESYGHWTPGYRIFVYRGSMSGATLTYFTWSGNGWADGSMNVRYCVFDPTNGQVTNGNGNSDPPGEDTGFNPLNPGALPAVIDPAKFLLMKADPRRGSVSFSFSDSVWLKDVNGQPIASQFAANTANARKVDVDTYRWISLLNPENIPMGQSPLSRIPNATITPGSEVVTGPDQRPGPHYGKAITYTRLPRNTAAGNIGLNEYVINYDQVANGNAVDPILAKGTVIFNSQIDEPNKPPVNVLPSIDADGNPAAPISVTYQVQNNQRGDVVKADYLTRQLMTFVLGVRLYDFQSGQPQQVSLTQQIRVRNLAR